MYGDFGQTGEMRGCFDISGTDRKRVFASQAFLLRRDCEQVGVSEG